MSSLVVNDSIEIIEDVNINHICYCSEKLLKREDKERTKGWKCKCCFKESTNTVYFKCNSGKKCLYRKMSAKGGKTRFCIECYDAQLQNEVMQNDIYSDKGFGEKEIFIHRKVMVSLCRIS